MAAAAARPAPRRFSLAPGPGTERVLDQGSVDAYEVRLAADQYLHLIVEQHGLDVVIDVFAPGGGGPLFRVDNLHGARSDEHVHLHAVTAGLFRLEVRACDPAAGPGRYLARIAALRPATAADRRRAAAEQAFHRARQKSVLPLPAPEREGLLARAGEQFRALGEREREAEADYEICRLDLATARPRAALGRCRRANALYRRLGERSLAAITDSETGSCHLALGDAPAAEASYRRALAGWRPPDPRRGDTLQNLGDALMYGGRPAAALRCFRQAAAIARAHGNRRAEAVAQVKVAWVYRGVGAWEDALPALQSALALIGRDREPTRRSAALNEMGNLFLDAAQPERALPRFEEALRLQRGREGSETAAVSLSGRGMSLRRLQRYAEAEEAYRLALSIFQRSGNRRWETTTWINLGTVHRLRGRLPAAAGCYGRALRLARATGFRALEAQALFGAALVARAQGDLAQALAAGEQAAAATETLRSGARRADFQASFLALNENLYDFLIDLSLQMRPGPAAAGAVMQALAYSEEARGRGLLDRLLARRGGRGLVPRLDHLHRLIAATDAELRRAAPAAQPRLRLRLAELTDQAQELDARFRQTVGAAALPLSAAGLGALVRQLLDADTLVLEYHLGRSRSFLWAIARDQPVSVWELPGRDRLEPLVRSTHELLAHSDEPDRQAAAAAQAASLAAVLLGPVADRLGARRLVLVANGALQYIPFAALPDPRAPGEPLLVRHEIVQVPSLTVLAELRAAAAAAAGRRAAGAGSAAVLADPVFGAEDPRAQALHLHPSGLDPLVAGLPRLPGTHREAQAIVDLAAGQRVLLAEGFDASAALVTGGALRGFRHLHLGTHGILRADRPELSALALSQLGREGTVHDGLLRVQDIEDLDLDADLVVLSACRTVLGERMGDELLGLPRAFLSAGARGVMMSLWSVGDRSTAELMRRFYQALLHRHQPPAAALRSAQLAMWREAEWRPAFHWGAFVVAGDWR